MRTLTPISRCAFTAITRFSVRQHEALAIGERDLDVGHVAQPYRKPVPPLQHQVAEGPGIERAGEPQGVATLADVHVAAGDVLVAAGEAGRGREVDAEARGPVRVERDPDLAFAPPVDLRARHPVTRSNRVWTTSSA